MIQFTVYIGWMKVAEALLNPLGEDDDDLECNYVIDKNLITGLTLVDQGSKKGPEQQKDMFWNDHAIAPLYSLEAARRSVHPLVGSASKINLVKTEKQITMVPHKSKLSHMTEDMQKDHTKVVDVHEHNVKHKSERRISKEVDPDEVLAKIRKRNLNKTAPMTSRSMPGTLEPGQLRHFDGNGRHNGASWVRPDIENGTDHSFDSLHGKTVPHVNLPPTDYSPYMGHRNGDDPNRLRRY
jgi:hypothetical protein